jgi:hypothetical protein
MRACGWLVGSLTELLRSCVDQQQLDSPSTEKCCGVGVYNCSFLKVARTGDPSTTEGTIVEEVDRFCRLCEGGGNRNVEK